MKAHELRELSDAELVKRIQEEEENLANLRFQKVVRQLDNPMQLRLIRRDISRMKTILHERQKNTANQPESNETKPSA